ncbi:hypothetical protein BLNAU_3358 [Blattamonas nauphoetae]|uniref:Uncharacterized protein n=1 Tax=Blattamonas nauphoetae TaxID=2049346 RepID=A0ABQ9YCW8_9EUKA|nr:hypothetical protein BLNAU_3358 [Blattamonas nauphoetae]
MDFKQHVAQKSQNPYVLNRPIYAELMPNWDGKELKSVQEQAVVFLSLVATLKSQPALDASLETKAVTLLKYLSYLNPSTVDAFLRSFAADPDDLLTDFVQSIGVLISSPNRAIAKATMEMFNNLFLCCSAKVRLALVKADVIPQLIMTLNPQSLSFAEAVDIHTWLIQIIANSVWLSTPSALRYLEIEDGDEQQAVHETVLRQVMAPSEQYIRHLCVNRYSIVDGDQSKLFLELFANLLQISPYYQPTMNFVVNMPVVFTIPSCLTLFGHEKTIWSFLTSMVNAQREWNKTRGEERQMGKTVHVMLEMEGIEDVIEEKLQNDANIFGRWIVDKSIEWNNLQGMNLPERE